jgi:hypothetical protein
MFVNGSAIETRGACGSDPGHVSRIRLPFYFVTGRGKARFPTDMYDGAYSMLPIIIWRL